MTAITKGVHEEQTQGVPTGHPYSVYLVVPPTWENRRAGLEFLGSVTNRLLFQLDLPFFPSQAEVLVQKKREKSLKIQPLLGIIGRRLY
jgi:hypothetical protein